MGLFWGTSRAVTLNYDETFCRRLFCAPVTSGTSRSARTYLYMSCVFFPVVLAPRQRTHLWSCFTVHSRGFSRGKIPFSFTYLFFFLSIPPSVLLYWAPLTTLKHSTSLSAIFVYIRVPPNNPLTVRAPSLGPRPSLFSEVSYRPFAQGRHFTSMNRILQGFAFLCKLGLLLFKPHWDYQI